MSAQRSWPTSTLIAIAILIGWFAIGVVASHRASERRSPEDTADFLNREGEYLRAENVYWALLDRGPVTVPLLIAFLDNHSSLTFIGRHSLSQSDDDASETPAPTHFIIEMPADEAHIDQLLASPRVAPDVALLGRYWRDVIDHKEDESDRIATQLAADANPPMPWANHMLAREALHHLRFEDAAVRFEREGEAFSERSADIDRALRIWMGADDWDDVARHLADPRVSSRASPSVHLTYALHARKWLDVARYIVPANYQGTRVGSVALAALAAFAWFLFCARAFRLGEDLKRRLPLFALAFVLGVISVYPTIVVSILEEHALHFVEKGNALADLIYFILGVGLREELSKLLLFSPLLLILRRRAPDGSPRFTKLDVLGCGALVGLGFASEENISYLRSGTLSVAITRFLTANFLHISTTAVLALALDHLLREPEKHSNDFSRALFMVIAVHGAYDFFLSNEEVARYSFFYVLVFIYLAREFFRALRELRGRGRSEPLLGVFAISMSLVIGASYAYAAWYVGPQAAASSMLEGGLGVVVFVFFFVREISAI